MIKFITRTVLVRVIYFYGKIILKVFVKFREVERQVKVVILAGGGGTRLFPLSRPSFPKQFLKIDGENSLLGQTVARFLSRVEAKDILVVTNQEYLYHVQSELADCGASDAHVILEPIGRNTAPAIALAVKYCTDVLDCNHNEVIFVSPADHVIRSGKEFSQCVDFAITLARRDKLVTFGILPSKPETGYGYIEAEEKNNNEYEVISFKEKPELALAKAYLKAGNYYWNSGMFAFTIGLMLAELNRYQPEIVKLLETDYEKVIGNFGAMPNISIDYAIAERSTSVMMVPLTCYWNDIGSWDAIYEVLEKDEAGNSLDGDCLAVDCKNSLFMGRDRLIVGIGLDDILLVETNDVIVAAKKGESQKVKDVVDELKRHNRKEAYEHTTLYRSWGNTSLLGEGSSYRMKKIHVKPGGKLSLQMHYHRSEHWIVISGTAKVTMGEEVHLIHENESVFIPQNVKHRLENPGKIPLEIIEVQNGSYIGEDDIVRFD